MNDTTVENPASSEVQMQNILDEIIEVQEKIKDTKAILKHYKIRSAELTSLKKKKKELSEAIDEEKERIENEFLEDPDFEEARNNSLTLKNQLKEKTAILKKLVRSKYSVPDLESESRLVKGEQMKLALEFSPTIYINGKELKS